MPGPGNYDPNCNFYSNKLNCFIGGKFGKETKDKNVSNLLPSPDTYFQEEKSMVTWKLGNGRGVKFGKDSRDWNSANASPGPCQYDIRGDIDI